MRLYQVQSSKPKVRTTELLLNTLAKTGRFFGEVPGWITQPDHIRPFEARFQFDTHQTINNYKVYGFGDQRFESGTSSKWPVPH